MKQKLFNLLFLCFFFTSHFLTAQDSPTDKGVILLKGSSNFNLTFSDGTPIQLGLGGGYFFFDKIPIGIDVSYFKSGDFSDFKFEPFGRYYFLEEAFGGAKLVSYTNEDGDDAYGFGLEGGYCFYLNDYVAIEPTFNLPLIENQKPSLKISFSIYY